MVILYKDKLRPPKTATSKSLIDGREEFTSTSEKTIPTETETSDRSPKRYHIVISISDFFN